MSLNSTSPAISRRDLLAGFAALGLTPLCGYGLTFGDEAIYHPGTYGIWCAVGSSTEETIKEVLIGSLNTTADFLRQSGTLVWRKHPDVYFEKDFEANEKLAKGIMRVAVMPGDPTTSKDDIDQSENEIEFALPQ